jgi:hypothetical protein
MHLLIPFAASATAGAHDALTRLQLPQLQKLLQRLSLVHTDAGAPDSRSPPHERALAHSLGLPLPDGLIPWAAWDAHSAGPERPGAPPGAEVCAWTTLCHWQARLGHISLSDPQTLGITPAESQTLLAAMRPYFTEDGITLAEHSAGIWVAQGEPLRGLECASLDRVVGRMIDDWMPQGPGSRLAHRLQNEMQMLLYTHPLNDAREARGQLPINSFWLHGAGALPPGFQPNTGTEPTLPPGLRDAALREDWAAWAQAWQALDAGAVTQALLRAEQGLPVTLTLCGERNAQCFELRARGLLQRVRSAFNNIPLKDRLHSL